MNHYITKTLIEDITRDELDIPFREKFGVDYDSDDIDDLVEIEKGVGQVYDNHPIQIDDVISILQSMKDKGANYVQISYHTDHFGYEFSAFNIEPSTVGEIEDYKNAKEAKKQAAKQKEIDRLQKQIENLKG